MANIRIKDLTRTAYFRDGEIIETDHSTDGSGKLDLGSIVSHVNARAPRQGLVFDGTAGATLVNVASLGTSFTVHIVARPNTLSVNLGVLKASGAVAGNVYFSANAPQIYNGTSYRGPGTATATVGKTDVWDYTVGGGVGTWYKNGISVWTGADAGTYPDAIIGVGVDANNYKFQGYLGVAIYNRALSAAEVLALYESGAPAASDYNSASNTDNSGNASFANTGSLPYTTFSGASSSGFAATSNGSGSKVAWKQYAAGLQSGSKYLVKFSLTLNSGTAPTVLFYNSGITQALSDQAVATAGSNSIIITASSNAAANSAFLAFQNASTASDYSISGLTVYSLGLLLAPNQQAPGAGLVLNDQSGNGAHIVLPTSGVSWNIPTNTQFRVRGTTSTNGNQQLLGATCLPANCQITRMRARARTNTPTITVWKDLTIALTGGIVSAASSIWIGSNSTDVVEIDITAEPLSF